MCTLYVAYCMQLEIKFKSAFESNIFRKIRFTQNATKIPTIQVIIMMTKGGIVAKRIK